MMEITFGPDRFTEPTFITEPTGVGYIRIVRSRGKNDDYVVVKETSFTALKLKYGTTRNVFEELRKKEFNAMMLTRHRR